MIVSMDVTEFNESNGEVEDVVLAALAERIRMTKREKKQRKNISCWVRRWTSSMDQFGATIFIRYHFKVQIYVHGLPSSFLAFILTSISFVYHQSLLMSCTHHGVHGQSTLFLYFSII